MPLQDVFLTKVEPWNKDFADGLTQVLVKGGFLNERGQPSVTTLLRAIAAAGMTDARLTADLLAAIRDQKGADKLKEYEETVADKRRRRKANGRTKDS